MCVLQHAYRFVAAAHEREFTLWPSVRKELLCLLCLLPLLQCSQAADFLPHVYASDASSEAVGVVYTRLTRSLASALPRAAAPTRPLCPRTCCRVCMRWRNGCGQRWTQRGGVCSCRLRGSTRSRSTHSSCMQRRWPCAMSCLSSRRFECGVLHAVEGPDVVIGAEPRPSSDQQPAACQRHVVELRP